MYAAWRLKLQRTRICAQQPRVNFEEIFVTGSTLSWYFRFSTGQSSITDNIEVCINTLRPRQDERHIADDTFERIFVNENARILIEISLKFVPKGPINNIPALVQIMAWRRPGDKPLSEPMMVS